jgi:hypothetical protein
MAGEFFFNNYTCPPTSHTVKLIFLYSTVSTLNPGDENVDDGHINSSDFQINGSEIPLRGAVPYRLLELLLRPPPI